MATGEAKRDEALRTLQNEIDEEELLSSRPYHSWVRGDVDLSLSPSSSPTNDGTDNGGDGGGVADEPNPNSHLPTNRCRFFDKHGFILLPNFATSSEVESMKSSMEELVNTQWKSTNKTQVFRTDSKQCEAQGKSDYFLDSASKCHFFAEVAAMDGDGELKEEYRQRKVTALNKAGHGLHTVPGPFQEYTQSTKIANLLRELGWVAPVVPQSMYIFKQAKIGGEVTSHQDSTFLYTTPRQTCIGLWLALDDATMDNGCLWVRPGSHKEGLRRQFVRNPKHFGNSLSYNNGGEEEEGDPDAPQMIFRQLDNNPKNEKVTWEGALPKDSLPGPQCTGLYDAGFVPVPCKAGDLLAFVGQLDHLSLPNSSNESRHTFQLHCVEGEDAGVTWSKENWLQYPPGVPFMKL
mmetsp:Transcript_47114/g.98790  ORF Transcript_47114/g.98790 Transcript_47114/m.98790 type:complete len:405 (-) Transcript_47114:294-1508(-)